MKSEIEQRLHAISKEQLIQLLQELFARHPLLLTEMVSILDGLNGGDYLPPGQGAQGAPPPPIHHYLSPTQGDRPYVPEDSDDEVTEDWDFNGEEIRASFAHPAWGTLPGGQVIGNPLSGGQVSLVHPFSQPPMPPLDSEAHYQRVEEYAARLKQQESPQTLFQVLTELVEEAIAHIAQHDDYAALDLFALLFDERLGSREEPHSTTCPPDRVPDSPAPTRTPALTSTYDQVIDAAMYSLEALLSEASSNTTFDADAATLLPQLTPQVRHHWLERLFALWLKRLDARRVEEDLPEIILDVAWNEDMPLLRSLAQNELEKKEPHGEHSNIVDFTRQYRTKALEKFLKELP